MFCLRGAFFSGGDFAGGGFAAWVAAITCEFDRVARVAAILAAIFAVFHCGAGAGWMAALVLLFHNSPRSLPLDALRASGE